MFLGRWWGRSRNMQVFSLQNWSQPINQFSTNSPPTPRSLMSKMSTHTHTGQGHSWTGAVSNSMIMSAQRISCSPLILPVALSLSLSVSNTNPVIRHSPSLTSVFCDTPSCLLYFICPPSQSIYYSFHRLLCCLSFPLSCPLTSLHFIHCFFISLSLLGALNRPRHNYF